MPRIRFRTPPGRASQIERIIHPTIYQRPTKGQKVRIIKAENLYANFLGRIGTVERDLGLRLLIKFEDGQSRKFKPTHLQKITDGQG